MFIYSDERNPEKINNFGSVFYAITYFTLKIYSAWFFNLL